MIDTLMKMEQQPDEAQYINLLNFLCLVFIFFQGVKCLKNSASFISIN
jgi:hypothetical protein